jgi:hypothetical protein
MHEAEEEAREGYETTKGEVEAMVQGAAGVGKGGVVRGGWVRGCGW